jgi:Tfp pilus assembly protein PilO
VNRRAPIIAGVIAVAVALLAVFLLVRPKMSEVSTTEDDLQTAEDQEVTLAAQLNALQDAQAAAPETEQEIAAIDAEIPPTADLPSLFRLLQGAADRSVVDFFSFTPGTPAPNTAGTFSTIASQVTVSGGYFAIDEFLFLLETLPRAAKVTTLAVTPSSAASGETTTTTSTGNLQLQLTVEFYTTDTSAGPGSVPGPSDVTGTGA